ncbi:TraI domain-containing protein [Photobacterium lutimaris]|uniref:Uncharacterized domain-containing protein n=1 Tax=Photobacterium lutimaris TaxID=388278 RepID=A0A2T3ITM0_9GAMM|nr:TraI domain-containing protein [Photobacterium lutimaris]PSU31693.1 hypothetical protein C9I99_21130 [Photobacterium lutimaris]TDR72670.1 putative helicase [Photobacterium lutimaris]
MKILQFGRRNKNTKQNKNASSKTQVETAKPTSDIVVDDGKQRFLDGQNVVKTGRCPELIDKIKEGLDCGPQYFTDYYLPVIHTVAAYCQALPASKNYHHTYPYGLIEHTLEVAMYSLRATRAYIYNPTGNEEDIDDLFHAYQYCVFLAAMHHDIGKVITDYRIEVRSEGMKHFVVWNPLKSLAPKQEGRIEYRFSRRITEDGKNLYNPNSHNIASLALFNRTVPSAGIDWLANLNSFMEIHLYHAIAGDYTNAVEVGAAVRDGDMNSTKLGKNAVSQLSGGDDGSIESVIRNSVSMILSEPDTYGLIVNKPHGTYCNAIRTYGKIFVAEHTMQQLIRPFVQEAKLSIPSNKAAWTKLIVDSCGLTTPSEDTMWWVLFTEQGVGRPDGPKDIAYLAFPDTFCETGKFLDSGLYPHYSEKTGMDPEQPAVVDGGGDDQSTTDIQLPTNDTSQPIDNQTVKQPMVTSQQLSSAPKQPPAMNTASQPARNTASYPAPENQVPQQPLAQPATNQSAASPALSPAPQQSVTNSNDVPGNQAKPRKRRNSKVAGKLPQATDVARQQPVEQVVQQAVEQSSPSQPQPVVQDNQQTTSPDSMDLPQDLLEMQVKNSDFVPNEHLSVSYQRLAPKLPRGLIVLKKSVKVDNKLIKEFLPRVQQFIESGQLPFNQKNAPIHVLEEGLFFALPSAFLDDGPFGTKAQNYKQMLQDSALTIKSSHKFHARLEGASLVTIRLGQEEPKNLNGVLLAISGFTFKGNPLPVNGSAKLLQDDNKMPDFKSARGRKEVSGVRLSF